jgi:hypothetical protein
VATHTRPESRKKKVSCVCIIFKKKKEGEYNNNKKNSFLKKKKRRWAHATIRTVPTAAKKYGGGLSELVAVAARVEKRERRERDY